MQEAPRLCKRFSGPPIVLIGPLLGIFRQQQKEAELLELVKMYSRLAKGV